MHVYMCLCLNVSASVFPCVCVSVCVEVGGVYVCVTVCLKMYLCVSAMGDLGLIPGLGRSPGEGKGHPLQYSGLENSMDCIVHRVTKSWTGLSDLLTHSLLVPKAPLGSQDNRRQRPVLSAGFWL